MNEGLAREDRLTLELLDAIGDEGVLGQRHVADRMGVALGLANSYLRRCIRKGYVKIKDAPTHRYLYYLTPRGFSEKSRLTLAYLTHSFEFYRATGHSCRALYEGAVAVGWSRAVLCGVSDLAEIAALRAIEAGVDVVGIYDIDSPVERFLRWPVARELTTLPPFDVCVLTDLRAPEAMYAQVSAGVDTSRILVPNVLRLR